MQQHKYLMEVAKPRVTVGASDEHTLFYEDAQELADRSASELKTCFRDLFQFLDLENYCKTVALVLPFYDYSVPPQYNYDTWRNALVLCLKTLAGNPGCLQYVEQIVFCSRHQEESFQTLLNLFIYEDVFGLREIVGGTSVGTPACPHSRKKFCPILSSSTTIYRCRHFPSCDCPLSSRTQSQDDVSPAYMSSSLRTFRRR